MMTLDWPVTPADLRTHLKLAHGVFADDEKVKANLVECHRDLHLGRRSETEIPHTHPGLVQPSPAQPLPRHGVVAGARHTGEVL